MLAEFYSVTEEGHRVMILSFALWTVSWIMLFLLIRATEPYWSKPFPKSTKAHENDRNWSARNVLGILHAILVSVLVLPACFFLFSASEDVRFGATGHLEWCTMDDQRAELQEQWGGICEVVAFAGIAFTAFTLADVFISVQHGLATPDYIAHHVAFISAGLVIRGHCMMPFNAAILLAMEVSTPFLNTLFFFRHRGPAYALLVQVNGIIFIFLFVVVRLGLNTYGAIALWYHRHMFPPTVPQWQVWFLLVAVTAGAAVQFFWFPMILKTFGSMALNLCRHRDNADLGAERLLRGGRTCSGTVFSDGSPDVLSNNATDYGSNDDDTPPKAASAKKLPASPSGTQATTAEQAEAPAPSPSDEDVATAVVEGSPAAEPPPQEAPQVETATPQPKAASGK